jgi:hypothetical protein
MVRAWRRITVAAMAGGIALTAQIAGVAPAQAATPAITIAATSRLNAVPGYVLVEYGGGSLARARIHGTITGAAAGQTAVLYAQQFPYAQAPARAGSARLRAGGTAGYSFTVTPTLATRYTVKLFPRQTATRPLITSPVQMVYVTGGESASGGAACGPPVCASNFQLTVTVPPSALRVEMSKRFYVYFGLSPGSNGHAQPPEWLYLNAAHPVFFPPVKRVSADQFVLSITLIYPLGNYSTWSTAWLACARDTLAKDGLGLPGHHGCGDNRIMRTVAYLG